MTAAPGESFYDFALAPEGAGGYAVFVVTFLDNATLAERQGRFIARMSDRGDLLSPIQLTGHSMSGINPALTRIGSHWLASWQDDTYATTKINQPYRVLLPIDGTTLRPGTPLSLPVNFPQPALPVAGRPGEALLLYNEPVSTSSLPVSRATVQLITFPGRSRAAGH